MHASKCCQLILGGKCLVYTFRKHSLVKFHACCIKVLGSFNNYNRILPFIPWAWTKTDIFDPLPPNLVHVIEGPLRTNGVTPWPTLNLCTQTLNSTSVQTDDRFHICLVILMLITCNKCIYRYKLVHWIVYGA